MFSMRKVHYASISAIVSKERPESSASLVDHRHFRRASQHRARQLRHEEANRRRKAEGVKRKRSRKLSGLMKPSKGALSMCESPTPPLFVKFTALVFGFRNLAVSLFDLSYYRLIAVRFTIRTHMSRTVLQPLTEPPDQRDDVTLVLLRSFKGN